jgi:hypothetical protein
MIAETTARAALAAIRAQFSAYLGDGEPAPEIRRDWDWLDSGPTPWAIVWEEGPDEWAHRAQQGGVDEHLTASAQDVIPGHVSTTPPAADWPEGTYAEPITSWAVAIIEI